MYRHSDMYPINQFGTDGSTRWKLLGDCFRSGHGFHKDSSFQRALRSPVMAGIIAIFYSTQNHEEGFNFEDKKQNTVMFFACAIMTRSVVSLFSFVLYKIFILFLQSHQLH